MGFEISRNDLDYFVTEKHLVIFEMYIEIHRRVIYFDLTSIVKYQMMNVSEYYCYYIEY